MVRFVKFLSGLLLNLLFRVELKDMKNIPDNGAAILCSNHPGELDMFLIAYNMRRLVHYMAKKELFQNRIMSFIMKKLGAFPVNREKPGLDSIREALKLLNEGHIIGIFPEGTRTGGKSPESITIKPGAALLASKAGVPVIPVAIKGNYKLFGKLKVIFGKPFNIGEVDNTSRTRSEKLEKISKDIMNRIYMLQNEAEA